MPSQSEQFLDAYIECALWASTDNTDDTGGKPLDDNYGPEDLSEETLASFKRDCEAFQEANADDLTDFDPEQAGHDFWLTRNGHGTGFWDRGLGELGDRLSKAAKVYGSVDLYVGNDSKIHGS